MSQSGRSSAGTNTTNRLTLNPHDRRRIAVPGFDQRWRSCRSPPAKTRRRLDHAAPTARDFCLPPVAIVPARGKAPPPSAPSLVLYARPPQIAQLCSRVQAPGRTGPPRPGSRTRSAPLVPRTCTSGPVGPGELKAAPGARHPSWSPAACGPDRRHRIWAKAIVRGNADRG